MLLTILHVEDDRFVADAVRSVLRQEDWEVITCGDGAVALNKIATNTTYDLLIIDNHLPNVNGLEIIRYARSLPHRRNTPIIMLTSSPERAAALEAGVNVFLEKPDDVGMLVQTIHRLLS
jgi:DNA-binding response OmpR family regulator